jgi:probable HAF family extracellular repeat protein
MPSRTGQLALLAVVTLLMVSCGSSEPAPVECSGYGELHGDHCHCDTGYVSEGTACVPAEEPVVECGGHGHLHDDHCHCDAGYTEEAGTCVVQEQPGPDCGEHGHSHGDHCHCDAGYVEENGTCVVQEQPGPDCGEHGHSHGDHCHCDAGYVEENGTCVPAPPPVDPVLPTYTIVPIRYPSGTGSFALELNDAGQVVGNVRSAVIGGTPPPLIAYRWSGDTLTELGILPGSNDFSRAHGINASGVVVGESDNNTPRAFRWEEGALTDLGTLGGASAVATAINDSGVIVGSSSNGKSSRAFRWVSGTMTDLGSLDGQPNTLARASGINSAGDVVGYSKNAEGVTRATLWSRSGTLVNLGALNVRQSSQAHAVNDSLQVVGSAVDGTTSGGSPIYQAFTWSDGTVRGLGTLASLPSAIHSEAKAINASGWIVGYVGQYSGNASLGSAAAVLWIDEKIHDLNTLVPPNSGWTLLSAEGINARGDIVGFGRLEGVTTAYKLVRQQAP